VDTERTLLNALHTDPADHTARLALADWLEEAGRAEQAELLRLHVRQMTKTGTRAELERLCALLEAGVRPVVPELVNSIGMRFALIPPGTFLMGLPEEEVHITRAFHLGVSVVTQAEYAKVMGKNPSHFSAGGGGKDTVNGLDTSRFPVECVSWSDAVDFCARLTMLEEKRTPGWVYLLPTEARWEYACRGGASFATIFHFGDSLARHQANFGRHLGRTVRVGSYAPNAFGLYDMHGNVWEWCHDWYAAYPRSGPRTDPLGPDWGSRRVRRGGGWLDAARYCESGYRYFGTAGDRSYYLGFRVALIHSGLKG
jgi:uncharacterized protein (TIGR02996 family)